MYFYGSFDNPAVAHTFRFAKTTLANTGQSYSACFQAPFKLRRLIITCESGTVIKEIAASGLTPV